MAVTQPGPDGIERCHWCLSTPDYIAYHDQEWGFPVADDRLLFEKLTLESFQSGLSWRTILAKRENFRAAFDGFDFYRIAAYTDADVGRLMADAGIVRHRGKIAAAINNAARAVDMVAREGSLAAYVWGYAGAPAASAAMSKDLKKCGWAFVGPTTVYAFMQAMGLVNDHAPDCAIHAKVAQARAGFRLPG
jgi:DNA-3-methyladenine glycosylase I